MKTHSRITYWSIATIGTALSFLLFYMINHKKVEKNSIILNNAVSEAEIKVTEELKKMHLALESMSFFCENTNTITSDIFQQLTNPIKEDLTGLKAIEYAPLMHNSDLPKLATKQPQQHTIQLKQFNDSEDLLDPNTKDIYYPVTIVNPPNLKLILGYDLHSDQDRQSAIIESTASNAMVLTSPLHLVDDNKSPGFLALKTVNDPNNKLAKGVVVLVYRMDQFLQNTLSDELNILELKITDLKDNDSQLFNSLSNQTTATNSLTLTVANRFWKISYAPKPAYKQFPHTVESYFLLLLGLTTTVLLIFNLKGRNDRSKQLEEKVLLRTEELEISNKQKENLLREIHHRVMNNLQITSSLLNLQKRKLNNDEAIYALSSSQDRIKAIALIHQKIYEHDDVSAIDLKGYLENLINSHQFLSPEVKYTIDCPELYIDLDTAVPIAIITSEIVVNALKHAFATTSISNMLYILVTRKKNDVLDIVISDNGSGLPKDVNLNTTSGLGYEIIKKMCRQLQAQYEFTSSSAGTTFSFQFKQRKPNIIKTSLTKTAKEILT